MGIIKSVIIEENFVLIDTQLFPILGKLYTQRSGIVCLGLSVHGLVHLCSSSLYVSLYLGLFLFVNMFFRYQSVDNETRFNNK